MAICFKGIDKSNYQECVALKVASHQTGYVATNAFSLVQAAYEDDLYPLAIYEGTRMVGFLLYDYDPELKGWSFSRFMIDHNYQNQGLGKQALVKFLEFFHQKYPADLLYTSAEVDNEVAIKLYLSHGFEKEEAFEYTYGGTVYHEYRMVKKTW